ncbi:MULTISPECIES: amidase family protein [unclassified Modicisalibacter]|uniref:amidase n=1 Tax=unclassified Modicisalibacter TaxID=2679913 RepID=UPI001CCC5062|nr:MULTISPECIES: amidase family protein [unclassified Modicisalibacter]MBZ9556509.1 amidase [Modicisalibacter sp. R2A 31.J]MBZ9575022.1 amidase [Modicisalibacter sp. MOD 31.J]
MVSDQVSTYRDDELARLDATSQAQLVERAEVSPLELVEAAIRRIERLDPTVNAVAARDAELAREKARHAKTTGPFAGVPTLLKDLVTYPGLPLGMGSRLFQGQVPPAGSAYTEALDASGLIVLGKSTTSEFGLLGTTETLACGATRNPWDLSRSPGGSSGGAVAAVAAGMVPVAHASDGGGSIRAPASFCGLFGFKPSRGRHLSTGQAADTPFTRMISEHCVSRSVRDSATWLSVVERDEAGLPGGKVGRVTQPLRRRLRIGLYDRTADGTRPEPEVAQALAETRRLCESLGHEVVDIEGPRHDARAAADAFFTSASLTLGGACEQLRALMGPAFDEARLEPYTRELIARSRALPPEAGAQAATALQAAADAAERAMAGFDVLLCPTVAFPAFPLGRHGGTQPYEAAAAFTEALAGYTAIASIAGWPAMSVPLHVSPTGLPIGSHFAAPLGQEARLLGLALELEQAAPWHHRWPTGAE